MRVPLCRSMSLHTSLRLFIQTLHQQAKTFKSSIILIFCLEFLKKNYVPRILHGLFNYCYGSSTENNHTVIAYIQESNIIHLELVKTK